MPLILQVTPYAGLYYYATLLWATGINRTLQANGSITDGVTVAQNMHNLTLEG